MERLPFERRAVLLEAREAYRGRGMGHLSATNEGSAKFVSFVQSEVVGLLAAVAKGVERSLQD
ncbi:MAG TPA: hypothetical protein VNQ90_02670 [Chthoniobacteraceae bacterium]|nr:hypothetical protein [Chthoniobacteraceae bacterium]